MVGSSMLFLSFDIPILSTEIPTGIGIQNSLYGAVQRWDLDSTATLAGAKMLASVD